jgi:hypothetical protein
LGLECAVVCQSVPWLLIRAHALDAWYLQTRGAQLDTDFLRARLAAVLPSFMLPEVITAVEGFAYTASGKVDYTVRPP